MRRKSLRSASWAGTPHSDYLGLHLQEHGLAVLRLHLCFHRPALFGGGLPGQRVRQLHEEQLLASAQRPAVQQVGQNLGLRQRRRFVNGLWLLYFNLLWLLFYWRQTRNTLTARMPDWKIVDWAFCPTKKSIKKASSYLQLRFSWAPRLLPFRF